jgi:lipid II:glycine glycyltransferase (peptidoglycan interpeptide bridge formation enzyme)
MRDSNITPGPFDHYGRIEFLIDLTLTNEQLTKKLSTNHKRKLKKAVKADLKHSIGHNLEAMRVLRSLQVRSRDRRIDRGEKIAIAEDSYYDEIGAAYFKRNLGEVHYLTHEGNAVSAAFISIYNQKAYYVFGGSTDDGFSMNAPGLLFMEIFTHCRDLGCLEFNLGGVPAIAVDKSAQSHGLYRFKSGFGGLEVPCTSLKADNLQPGRDFLFNLARKILRGR